MPTVFQDLTVLRWIEEHFSFEKWVFTTFDIVPHNESKKENIDYILNV